jgi:hypothetical protein
LSSFLFEVSAADPVTYVLAAALLFTATLLTTYLPARKAARIDPIEVLRAEWRREQTAKKRSIPRSRHVGGTA